MVTQTDFDDLDEQLDNLAAQFEETKKDIEAMNRRMDKFMVESAQDRHETADADTETIEDIEDVVKPRVAYLTQTIVKLMEGTLTDEERVAFKAYATELYGEDARVPPIVPPFRGHKREIEPSDAGPSP